MKSKNQKPARSLQTARDLTQQILINTNCLWREMTMKSKPRADYVSKTVFQLRDALKKFDEALPGEK